MGPTWGPPGSCRPQMDPMLAQWTLLSGYLSIWGQRLLSHYLWCYIFEAVDRFRVKIILIIAAIGKIQQRSKFQPPSILDRRLRLHCAACDSSLNSWVVSLDIFLHIYRTVPIMVPSTLKRAVNTLLHYSAINIGNYHFKDDTLTINIYI